MPRALPEFLLRIVPLVVASLALAQLTACADTREVIRATLARRTAYIERNMLESMPCIGDGIRTTFNVPSENKPSYAQAQLETREAVKHLLSVKLTPESAGIPAAETRTVVYEIFDGGRNRTGVKYGVEAPGAILDAWWEEAFRPLAGCGAVKK